METKITVHTTKTGSDRYCNCCGKSDMCIITPAKFYEVRMPSGHMIQVIKLCETCLDELRQAAFQAMTFER